MLRFCVLCVSIVPEADIAWPCRPCIQGGVNREEGGVPPPAKMSPAVFIPCGEYPGTYLRESQAEGAAVMNTDVSQH